MTNTLTATLRTSRGPVVVRLFPDHAPKTVRNFVELAEGSREWTNPATRKTGQEKLYDGTIFHRVIPDFMIQGGDPLGTGTGGPGYKFGDEFHPDLAFDRPYLLAMANAGPGTNGSQFFITTVATPWLNRQAHDLRRGRRGADIVDEISRVQTGRGDKPVDRRGAGVCRDRQRRRPAERRRAMAVPPGPDAGPGSPQAAPTCFTGTRAARPMCPASAAAVRPARIACDRRPSASSASTASGAR